MYIGPKITSKTNHFHITLRKYLHHYKAKYKELYLSCTYVGLYGSGLFDFESYANHTFLVLTSPTSSSFFIENVF